MALDTLVPPARRWLSPIALAPTSDGSAYVALAAHEEAGARNYPLSRWYLRPAAERLAVALANTSVRPWHLSACGLLIAALAAGVISTGGAWPLLAAALLLLAWFFDRADGLLARRQGTASPRGAWLDANIDELTDVGLHMATAWAAFAASASAWPVVLLIAFLAGKHWLMHGLATEAHYQVTATPTQVPSTECRSGSLGWLQRLYHLPANADVRIHLLAIAVAGGWLTTELAIVALYYNLRALARFGLVCRRLPGGAR